MIPTVVIITKNEERNIEACLDSIPQDWPTVVVDAYSTDRTVEIVTRKKARIIQKDWQGFGAQKQFGVDAAKAEWVLSLDADEKLSSELINEISALAITDRECAFKIPRKSFFLGKPINFCGWRPDYVIRLFNSSVCKFSKDIVHESIEGYTTCKSLQSSIIHFPYQTEKDVRDKSSLYGRLGKEQVSIRGKYSGRIIASLKSTWSFFRTYFIKLGFLDGGAGLKISLMNAKVTYSKYR